MTDHELASFHLMYPPGSTWEHRTADATASRTVLRITADTVFWRSSAYGDREFSCPISSWQRWVVNCNRVA